MRQKATVERLLPEGRAELSVRRQSACSGDCGGCGGCGGTQQSIRLTAENPIHAQRGDIVYIESESSTVLKAATLVYLLPLALFLVCYLLTVRWGNWAFCAGFGGFLLGLLPAFLYNRHMKRKPPKHVIVGFVR